MKHRRLAALVIAALASTSAQAIDAKYRKQLERSGCTQVSEAQGCDITKTRAENAKAGFGSAAADAHGGINSTYAQQLERSGCTQLTENQGCDIHKTKAQNAKAGFGGSAAGTTGQTPYAGQWIAIGPTGGTVATIRIDPQEHVWVNGKRVNAKRSDGALVFRQGFVTYTIQGDRRLKGEDTWRDSDAGSTGPIYAE